MRTAADKPLPARIIVHGNEKWGKTSFAAHAPKPLFLMTAGETGLITLIEAGLLPPTPHLPELKGWLELRSAVQALLLDDHPYRTLVIDTANGAANMLADHTVRTKFDGEFLSFDAYGRGQKAMLPEWVSFIESLDTLRERKGMGVILLAHTVVKPFRNPEGNDYDRYQPDMPVSVWGLTHKWADAILFGSFVTVADKKVGEQRAKGKGGDTRLIYTTRTAAYDAGNRYNLPDAIPCGGSPREAWSNFAKSLTASRQAPPAPPDSGDAPGGDGGGVPTPA